MAQRNQNTWAVQPAAWAKFDEHGAVYCESIEAAYQVCKQIAGEGDQVIYKLTAGEPIKWVRVTGNELVQSA